MLERCGPFTNGRIGSMEFKAKLGTIIANENEDVVRELVSRETEMERKHPGITLHHQRHP
jgi:hypothetical protein